MSNWADSYNKRKQFLITHAPLCDNCYSTNVELLEPYGVPAQWICRDCGINFPYEPEE